MQETNRPELEDAQRFRRVWQRVQGGREEAERAAAEGTELPVQSSAPWEPTAFLQDAIVRARLRGSAYRQWVRLAPLAGLTLSQARRLTAALFLLRGIRTVPQAQAPGRRWASLEESCRQLYLWERREEADYRIALGRTADPELQALFRELAGECAIQQQRLRGILEEIME
ncbi:MAG: hypothetical protein ACI3U8_08185 [Candidatus Onthomonas sp.]